MIGRPCTEWPMHPALDHAAGAAAALRAAARGRGGRAAERQGREGEPARAAAT